MKLRIILHVVLNWLPYCLFIKRFSFKVDNIKRNSNNRVQTLRSTTTSPAIWSVSGTRATNEKFFSIIFRIWPSNAGILQIDVYFCYYNQCCTIDQQFPTWGTWEVSRGTWNSSLMWYWIIFTCKHTHRSSSNLWVHKDYVTSFVNDHYLYPKGQRSIAWAHGSSGKKFSLRNSMAESNLASLSGTTSNPLDIFLVERSRTKARSPMSFFRPRRLFYLKKR